MPAPPPAIVPLLTPFAGAFTAPTFRHVLVLVSGTLLASGRRTVAAALRAVGLGAERCFARYHRVLNRGIWSPLVLSRLLLDLLVRTFLEADAPLELVVDGTLERRRGRHIAFKGRFHDAVRSQPGHVATSESIHRVCVALLVVVPWSRRRWALPFLAIPTFAPATSAKLGRRHRTAPERTEGLVRLIRRWQPQRAIRVVGDSSFATMQLRHHGARPDLRGVQGAADLALGAQGAALRAATGRPASTPGVKPKKGRRQPKLVDRLAAVRRQLWASRNRPSPRRQVGMANPPAQFLDLLVATACYAT